MSFEVISEEGHDDYEIWTCDRCGFQVVLAGVGGDVAECPKCIVDEYTAEAAAETNEKVK
jgi:predicted nucleic-acid-binding Zn-ribbon protein